MTGAAHTEHPGSGMAYHARRHTVGGVAARVMCPPSFRCDLGAWLLPRARFFRVGGEDA